MRPERLRLATGLDLPGEGPLDLAASLWRPHGARRLWVCLPGGNMNRHYFDLQPPRAQEEAASPSPDDAEDWSYSFAAQMTARGDAVLALDHLGIGESDRPMDGWQLTAERLAQATAQALALARERHADLAALPAIGLGHSMGAMMTVLVQHLARPYAAIALLGFSTRGLATFLPPALQGLTGPLPDGEALRPHAERMFREPFPVIHRSRRGNRELFGSASAEAAGIAALKRATDCLLPLPALRSMLPGNVAREAATLREPVFLGIGDRDMVGPPEAVPAAFPASRQVTLTILPDTGHSHFLFPSRSTLFRALGDWAKACAP